MDLSYLVDFLIAVGCILGMIACLALIAVIALTTIGVLESRRHYKQRMVESITKLDQDALIEFLKEPNLTINEKSQLTWSDIIKTAHANKLRH